MEKELATSCLLRVGQVLIRLICPSAEYASGIKDYFQARELTGEPDVELAFSVAVDTDLDVIPDSLFHTKQVFKNEIDIAGRLVRGHFTPATGKGNLSVHYLLTSSNRTKVFEQLLFQAFYSGCKRKKYQALLIHACGVIKDGAGYLFVGPSGSGKTTIASLSADYLVVNDEISLLEMADEAVSLCSTPFSGFFRDKKEGAAPLKAIIFLKQAPRHRFYLAQSGHNTQKFFKEIVPPIGLEDELRTATYIKMLDKAAPILKQIPVYTLEFRQDAGFWQEMERVLAGGE